MNISWKKLEHEWRKQLLSYAKGNILEVGIGEGGNFKYYPLGTTITATDMSARMIGIAKKEAAERGVKTNFIVSPIDELQFNRESFDTIVSTFSLSSFEKPERVLDHFNAWCKPDGRILLLEYGLSKYGLINWLQRKWATYHYKRTGSHIDRDMLSIIAGSKLCIKKVEVKYAGVVYLVWASLCPAKKGHN
ncbi:MAG TPA: class I SAM-dependent methyltransferase [Chitinophagaceae bacterium]